MIYQNKKIGILGGSFDPIHNGHLNIAKSAYDEFQLDEVWFIPAGHSPNKQEDLMTPANIRAKMVSLAIENIPYFKLSTYEIENKRTSYTYLTLSDFKEDYSESTFYFIMGADSLDYFETWSHPEIICEKAIILVAVRDDLDLEDIHQKIKQIQAKFKAEIYPLHCQKITISSSQIRLDFANHIFPKEDLPDKVFDYIVESKLYLK